MLLKRLLLGSAIALGILVRTSPANAEARLAHIFQDNMVLQRDAPVPVWGWADPGADVEVSLAGQQQKAKAGADGYWRVTLTPLAVSREGRVLDARIGGTTVSRKNVLVGEVWIAAGQSNMNHAGPDRATGLYPHHVSPGTATDRPAMRITRFGFGASLDPLPDIDPSQRGDAPWETVPEDSTKGDVSLPMSFARVLRDGLGVPVGIIHVAVSGTSQDAWMARKTLEGFPGTGGATNFYAQQLAYHEKGLSTGAPIKSWDDFVQADAKWRETGKGRWPGDLSIMKFPGVLYNTRIHPLAPFAVRGAIWHQGEGGPGGPYGERLVAMANQWRERFGQPFVFIWGTLGRNTSGSPPLTPLPDGFYRSSTNVEIRKALGLFGKDNAVALVELYDVGNNVTHFLQKAEAGRRMALAALTVAYGQDQVYTGPRVTDVALEGGKVRVRFTSVGKGIVYQPSIDGISGVYISDAKGPFRWANVSVVDASTIEISHPEVAEIATVAYADNSNPHETLFNSEGLPASPFRRDLGTPPRPSQARDLGLIGLEGPANGKPEMNLAHVRADGYVFQILPDAKGPRDVTVAVLAYVAPAWKAVAVEIDGKPVSVEETTADGRRIARFQAPANGAWIVVCEKGKADALRAVHRY